MRAMFPDIHAAGKEAFFKTITTYGDFERELLQLASMVETGLPGYVNILEFLGIVVSEDGFSAIGMLLT